METAFSSEKQSSIPDRSIKQVSESFLAEALILDLVDSRLPRFSLMGFYDDDREFLVGLAERLNIKFDVSFINKLRKVVRRLVSYGVLYSCMSGTAKEYVDEPAKQMNYTLKTGKAELIRRGKTEHTQEPEWEVAFLLRHAYPDLLENFKAR